MLLITKPFRSEASEIEQQITSQTLALRALLKKARKTEFGKAHQFQHIISSNDLHDEFRNQVPLTNYDFFYEKWMLRSINGENNIIWPDKINYFALSSGTTTGGSKKLPVSKDMLKQFFKQTRKQILAINRLDLPKSFYKTSCLTLGGSTQLKKINNSLMGDLSGILQKNTPYLYRPFKKPGKRISAIDDWDQKLQEIIKKAPKWNIGTVAGVPNWILFVLEGIINHYGLKNIHEIWPNFNLCLHGGIELGIYKDKILSLCDKDILFLNTYLASEGYFAHQTSTEFDNMEILSNNGIYFEFIEKKYFGEIQKGNLTIPTLSWSEIEKNKEYGLVITTNSGLWRYIIGDTVIFDSDKLDKIKFQGRIQQTMNGMGEHLTLSNLTSAIHKTAKIVNADISEFCVHSNPQRDKHYWYLGCSSFIKSETVKQILDDELKALNDDYRSLRKFVLSEPNVKVLPIEKFYEYLKSNNKIGGQNKFPRVLNGEQIDQWKRFLSC